MESNFCDIELEAEVRRCLPDLSDGDVVMLVSYLQVQGVLYFKHLQHLTEEEIVNSRCVTKIQAKRLISSCEEAINEEREVKEKSTREQQEKKEKIAEEELQRKKLEVKLLEIVELRNKTNLELTTKREQLYGKSIENHRLLRSEADGRVKIEDAQIARGSALGGIGAGVAIGAAAGPPGMIIGGIAGALVGGGGGLAGAGLSREGRTNPKLQEAKEQAELDEMKLLKKTGIEELEKSITNMDQDILYLKDRLRELGAIM